MAIRDTLTRAIRMTGARALGDDPSAEEMAAGLDAFKNMLLSLPRPEMTDVLISEDYEAGENERITITSGTPNVTLPSTIEDEVTGEDRPPHDGSFVIVTGATPAYWYYAKPLADWVDLYGLVLDDPMPLGPEHEEGAAAMVAVRIAPDLQVQNVPQWVVAMAENGRRTLRRETFQSPSTGTAEYF